MKSNVRFTILANLKGQEISEANFLALISSKKPETISRILPEGFQMGQI